MVGSGGVELATLSKPLVCLFEVSPNIAISDRVKCAKTEPHQMLFSSAISFIRFLSLLTAERAETVSP